MLVMSVNPGFGGQKFIASQLTQDRGGRQADRQARPRRRRSRSTAGSIADNRARRRSTPAPTCWSPAPRRSAAAPRPLCRQYPRRCGETDERRRRRGRARYRPQARAAARLLSRLFGSQPPAAASWSPCRATMSHGDRAARRRLARRPLRCSAARRSTLDRRSTSPRSAPPARSPSSCRASPGCATSPPPPSARKARALAEALAGRWLLAHGTRVDDGLARPICGASGSSSGPPTRPTSCRAATPAIARPCSTRWRAARAISTRTPTRRRAGPAADHRLGRRGRRRRCSSRAAWRGSRAARPG